MIRYTRPHYFALTLMKLLLVLRKMFIDICKGQFEALKLTGSAVWVREGQNTAHIGGNSGPYFWLVWMHPHHAAFAAPSLILRSRYFARPVAAKNSCYQK